MQRVFDGPVIADHRAGELRGEYGGCDVEAGLSLDCYAELALALDHDDALQSGPVVPRPQQVDVMDGGTFSCLDATVIGIDGFVRGDLGIDESPVFCAMAKISTSSRRVPCSPAE